MHARVLSGAVLGIDAYLVQVEADVANDLPNLTTVGLPQGAVREGEKRFVAAVKNSGYEVPPKRITVNLAPADATKAKLTQWKVGRNHFTFAPGSSLGIQDDPSAA